MVALRVLLVEDNGELRVTIAEFLREEGFDVVEVPDGHEATRLLDDVDSFDALFTDVQMPGTVDGVDVAARARRRNPAIAVLVMSGNLEQLSGRPDVLEPSAVVLRKPFRMREVAGVLKGLINLACDAPAYGLKNLA